jgi:periplasmic protein TonB
MSVSAAEFVSTRRVPPDAVTRRWRRFGLAGAIALHGSLIALLLFVRPWEAAPPKEFVYDLVFVPPAPPPAAAAPSEEVLIPPTPLSPPEPLAEPDPLPVPAVTTVPELPKPVPRPHRAPAPQVQPPARSTVEAPTDSTTSSTAPVTAAVAPPVAQSPAARPAPDPAYTNTLLAWLDRHKEYPWTARRRGMQGRVVLRLAVARSGAVTEARVESSSGAEILDEAAIEMVQRANPVPPLPASFPGDHAEFRVPVEFALSSR